MHPVPPAQALDLGGGVRLLLEQRLQGTHYVTKERAVTVRNVKVLPQPVGAYVTWSAARAASVRDMRVLVVDVGHYSCDFVVMRGAAIRDLASGSNRHAMAVILEEAWHANRLISDLLDYGRVQPPRLRAVSARQLLTRVAAAHTVEPLVKVEIEAPESPRMLIDEDQVTDAIDNLFRNALDAMPGGGTLRLAATPAGAKMRLTICDTGAGVPPEIKARLFEPLVTSKPLGRGLGLTTARALIENQGGTITSEDAEVGACFLVCLPLGEDPDG